MKLSTFFFLLFFVYLSFISLLNAQEIREYTPQEIKQLTKIKYNLMALDSLEQKKIISATISNQEKQLLEQKASNILKITEKNKLRAVLKTIDEDEGKNLFLRIRGFFTFVNIMIVLSAILLVVAISMLMGIYLVAILSKIPIVVYEFLMYGTCFFGIFWADSMPENIKVYIVFPCCLGLLASLYFSVYIHKWIDEKSESNNLFIHNSIAFILLIIWGISAYYFQSILIGFITIMALYTILGFTIHLYPSIIFIGFRKDDVILLNIIVSFILLTTYIILKKTELLSISYVLPFAYGTLFIGSFSYYIGLLIYSNFYFFKIPYGKEYFLIQIITIISGILALWIGSIENIPLLRGIGGTFFVIYLLEKYYEINWSKIGYVWSLLGLAIILYLTALVVRMYPDYFFMG